MRRILILAAAALVLAACGPTSSLPSYHPLYYWGGSHYKFNGSASAYEDNAYNYYVKQTPEAICALIVSYEDMVKHPGGIREVPPPGICAEYGYLLLMPNTASIFAEHATASQKSVFEGHTDYIAFFSNYAGELFEKELELYPESQAFIKPLVERLTGRN